MTSTRPAWIAFGLSVVLPALLFIGNAARMWEGAGAMYRIASSPWGYAVVPGLLVVAGLAMWLSATDTWRNIPGLERAWLKDVRAEAIDRGVTSDQYVQWREWRASLRELVRRMEQARRGKLGEGELAKAIADTWWTERESTRGGHPGVNGLESSSESAGRYSVDDLDLSAYLQRLRRYYRDCRPWTVQYPIAGPRTRDRG